MNSRPWPPASQRPHLRAGLSVLTLLAASSLASAQRLAPGEVSTTVNLSALTQLDTDLDQGGQFSWSGADVQMAVTRQFTPALSAGITARYGTERWSFDKPNAFGPQAPWTDIHRPSIGFNVGYALAPDLALFVAPQFEWAYESGASASDSHSFGAVLGATKFFSPKLFVGLGLGAFRQIDSNKYFPFVIVNWQITDEWRLSNPLRAGPAGGAGLELSYMWAQGWEAGVGAAYREYRFRLSSDAPTPNGIGQNQGVPVFARVTRSFGPAGQVDLFAGMLTGGKLQVDNAAGSKVQSSGYASAPLIALTGTIKF
jgi:hypothetical protein